MGMLDQKTPGISLEWKEYKLVALFFGRLMKMTDYKPHLSMSLKIGGSRPSFTLLSSFRLNLSLNFRLKYRGRGTGGTSPS